VSFGRKWKVQMTASPWYVTDDPKLTPRMPWSADRQSESNNQPHFSKNPFRPYGDFYLKWI